MKNFEEIMILYFHVSQFPTNMFHIPILPKKVGVKYLLLKEVNWIFFMAKLPLDLKVENDLIRSLVS